MRFVNVKGNRTLGRNNKNRNITLWQLLDFKNAEMNRIKGQNRISRCLYGIKCPQCCQQESTLDNDYNYDKNPKYYIVACNLKTNGVDYSTSKCEFSDSSSEMLDDLSSPQERHQELHDGQINNNVNNINNDEEIKNKNSNNTQIDDNVDNEEEIMNKNSNNTQIKDNVDNEEEKFNNNRPSTLVHPKSDALEPLNGQKLNDISIRYNFTDPLLKKNYTKENLISKQINWNNLDDKMINSQVVGIPHTKIFHQKNIPPTKIVEIIDDIFVALSEGIEPIANRGGSSGSYLMKSSKNSSNILAIFKPKDEEVYSLHNPNIIKYFQRHLFPCCFGRGCIAIGQGYLSEAGAYLVDQYFGINLVPPTYIVEMASKRFNYFNIQYPKLSNFANIRSNFDSVKKIGSLQMFVQGYLPSNLVLPLIENLEEGPLFDLFLYHFQRMTILDYLIRNTDRNRDNWLIKYDPDSQFIDIAAIDNGLAFPFKHPDQWRAYPYHWSTLKWATYPYTERIRKEFLEKLNSTDNIEQLTGQLYDLFSIDKKFDFEFFQRQMAVLRGEVLNLVYILSSDIEQKKSPQDLLMVPVMFVIKGTIPLTKKFSQEIFIGKIDDKRPMFTCF